ncbi:MAG: alpha-hydroxy acid oxidase [Pseudomonadota bacterium]
MDLDHRFPAISDLRERARARLPRFVWDYLDSATGNEAAATRNEVALDAVLFRPDILFAKPDFDLSTRFLGRDYAMPVGIAPVGMSGLIWPGAEVALARLAAKRKIAYTLSTVATQRPEAVGPKTDGAGWFQLYPPRDPKIRKDMLRRIADAGFEALVLTVDVPFPSRRERQRRGGLTHPPTLSPRILAQCAAHPAWSLATAMAGLPRLAFIEDYTGKSGALSSTGHVGYLIRTAPTWDYLHALRDLWPGPFVVKGVLSPEHAVGLQAAGVDAVWVSNHGGRQFEGAPASLDALVQVRAAVGPDYPLIFDSGVRGGLDVLRALALGADFVFLGRAFHYGLAALGPVDGPRHVLDILEQDIKANLGQLGLSGFSGLSERRA